LLVAVAGKVDPVNILAAQAALVDIELAHYQ
jgi:hypothetical protein